MSTKSIVTSPMPIGSLYTEIRALIQFYKPHDPRVFSGSSLFYSLVQYNVGKMHFKVFLSTCFIPKTNLIRYSSVTKIR